MIKLNIKIILLIPIVFLICVANLDAVINDGEKLTFTISYGIIKECGGNIRVAPVKGEGACFIITFPIT